MFKIESYITPILLSYVDKYVKDFKPADAQVSLWKGGVALHNLVIKTDVVHQEINLPLTLVSGRIHELLIQVPWTRIISEPIVVTIDTIECILNTRTPTEAANPGPPSNTQQDIEAPPGYMQALVRRIVSNISIKIHHLIVKYVQDDIVLSLNVKHLLIDSAGADWNPAFADIDPITPLIRRLVTLDDLTLCLDNADSDGKIRFYQAPILYRCGLKFRVLTKLVSPTTRRANSIAVQLHTKKLAFGITSEQLLLLLRLLKEHSQAEKASPPPPTPKKSTINSKNSLLQLGERHRNTSWTEWAASWMPTLSDREGSADELRMPAQALPITFAGYFDECSLTIKVLHKEATHKRSENLLELFASYVAIKCYMIQPTNFRLRFGCRSVSIQSTGKCVCGFLNPNGFEIPTVYLSNREEPKAWEWPKETNDVTLFEAEKAEETEASKTSGIMTELAKESSSLVEDPQEDNETVLIKNNEEELSKTNLATAVDSDKEILDEKLKQRRRMYNLKPASQLDFTEPSTATLKKKPKSKDKNFWEDLSAVVYFDMTHKRSPPDIFTNPYENPPKDFEYSDWQEDCSIEANLNPMDLNISIEIIHRLNYLKSIFCQLQPALTEPMRTLTVEECEALNQNIPQRRISITITENCINVIPWEHKYRLSPPITLQIELPNGNLMITAPLYAKRVCSAAAQLPKDEGILWQGCRIHGTAALNNIKVSIYSPREDRSKPCGRLDLNWLIHILPFPEYFASRNSVSTSYALKIKEMNISGSAARLNAAAQIIISLLQTRLSNSLYYSSLAEDAFNDKDLVALDINAEEFILRGFVTKKSKSYISVLQSLRVTVFRSASESEEKSLQAWVFSGPAVPTPSPYFRFAFQYCEYPFPEEFYYCGLWTEPTAVALDPLLVSWLCYKPKPKPKTSSQSQNAHKRPSSISFKQPTPPSQSSSGLGATRSGNTSTTGTNAEQVHAPKPRSQESSDLSEHKQKDSSSIEIPDASMDLPFAEKLLNLHDLLKKYTIRIILGLTLVYMTTKSASAVDCETVSVAMENHATNVQPVMVFSLGNWSIRSNSKISRLWRFIKQDGPTYLKQEAQVKTSFPWTMAIDYLSCYSLQSKEIIRNSKEDPSGLKSGIKSSSIKPYTIVDNISTNITLSAVSRAAVTAPKVAPKKSESRKKIIPEQVDKNVEETMKYFEGGIDFKPTTCLEFLRGPKRRKKECGIQASVNDNPPANKIPSKPIEEEYATSGATLGFDMHADTPPIVIRVEHREVELLSVTIHCLNHIISLLKYYSLYDDDETSSAKLINPSPNRSDVDDVETLTSEYAKESNILVIRPQVSKADINTYFFCQWVISRATVVFAAENVKFITDIDDISTSTDLQQQYTQFKVKISSVSIKSFERRDTVWIAGELGGRVLEAREPIHLHEENNFLSITITAAKIADLPESWKQQMHPKVLENKAVNDTIWEIYTVLAPMELIIQPKTLDNMLLVAREMTAEQQCSFVYEKKGFNITGGLPYCYLTAGGIKVVLACEVEINMDDTFVFTIGKIKMNPYPENPIFRRTVITDLPWTMTNRNMEGMQYELSIKGVSMNSTKFLQIVAQEEELQSNKVSSENPAHKWSYTATATAPTLAPMLHPLNIDILYAPEMYVDNILFAGAAVEINLTSECDMEVNTDQVLLTQHLLHMANRTLKLKRYLNDDILGKGLCPYLSLLFQGRNLPSIAVNVGTDTAIPQDESLSHGLNAADSVITNTSSSSWRSHNLDNISTISLSSRDFIQSDYFEIFISTGSIEVSLYTENDGSPEALQVYPKYTNQKTDGLLEDNFSDNSSRTVSQENEQENDIFVGVTLKRVNRKKITSEYIPLLLVSFHQANLYFSKRKTTKNMQVSLYNMKFSLGSRITDNLIHAEIISTGRGQPEPDTEIPPALATLKYNGSPDASKYFNSVPLVQRGTLTLDIDRPIMIQLTEENVRRLVATYNLIMKTISLHIMHQQKSEMSVPFLDKIRNFFVNFNVELIHVKTSQIYLSTAGATIGWENMTLKTNLNNRNDRIETTVLIDAMTLSEEIVLAPRSPVIVQPFPIGFITQICWEAWHRDAGHPTTPPSVHILVDIDWLTIDLHPDNLDILKAIQDVLKQLENITTISAYQGSNIDTVPWESTGPEPQGADALSVFQNESDNHFYTDDLRSGTFKIVKAEGMPLVYQITLYKDIVSWRYPHPRTITNLIINPLLDHTAADCVLEFFSQTMRQWEPYLYVTLPTIEPIVINLNNKSPEMIFSCAWRFRSVPKPEIEDRFTFDIRIFKDLFETKGEDESETEGNIQAEQLWASCMVDSLYAPALTPRTSVAVRLAGMSLYLHCLPPRPYISDDLEGFYILHQTHRMLAVCTENSVISFHSATTGSLLSGKTQLSALILDISNGTMGTLIKDFAVQMSASFPNNTFQMAQLRVCTSSIRVALQIARLRTLQVLINNWLEKYHNLQAPSTPGSVIKAQQLKEDPQNALEGRICLWIHNNCSTKLYIGQESCDEYYLLGPGVKLAYRWRFPDAPKKLRFSTSSPDQPVWSNSIKFTAGEHRICLDEGTENTGGACYLFVTVKEECGRRCMTINGRLLLANMLKFNFNYKVRMRNPESDTWNTLDAGELIEENIGKSVITYSTYDLALKIRFINNENGWSGDIPLRECPKENVPWLVKVPSIGEVSFISVWCRVTRARSDGRIIASLWPLFMLRSRLTLDTDILVSTQISGSEQPIPPIMQTGCGRDAVTQILAPGTTAARHSLTFQYRNIETTVTRESVPLHYGITNTSVFQKTVPIKNINQVLDEIRERLENSDSTGNRTAWPYSIVKKHINVQWKPALLQPHCDVAVRYEPIRVGGGGCSLELQLSPIVIVCNALPMQVTLRAHDAAPLCRLESGYVISPPSIILKKQFYLSLEFMREAFVTKPLEVHRKDPGRYGALPPGHVAIDHPIQIAIPCAHKVSLFTLHYEIVEEINVLGLTPSYIFINNLDREVLICNIALPVGKHTRVQLRPDKYYRILPSTPAREIVPIVKFWLQERWRGGDASELQAYMCLRLPINNEYTDDSMPFVPVKLGTQALRHSIALCDQEGGSVAAVLTQHKHEGRVVVTLSPDPCPQFLICNYTSYKIAVGKFRPTKDPWDKNVQVVEDCEGLSWRYELGPHTSKHYSLPGYVFNHSMLYEMVEQPQLSFARLKGYNETGAWCSPVTITDGEQMVQLAEITVKVVVQMRLHSSIIELQDVGLRDISASAIRERLLRQSQSTDSSQKGMRLKLEEDANEIGRLNASQETHQIEKKDDIEETGAIDKNAFKTGLVTDEIEEENDIKETGAVEEIDINILEQETRAGGSDLEDGFILQDTEWQTLESVDRVLCNIQNLVVELAESEESLPLVAAHVERIFLHVNTLNQHLTTEVSIADIQVDNPQYESGLYDFAVSASTRSARAPLDDGRWPAMFNMFMKSVPVLQPRSETARVWLKLNYESWTVLDQEFTELTEVELRGGPLALYVEDAHIAALENLFRQSFVRGDDPPLDDLLAEARSLRSPLRLKQLIIHPIDMSLTLHTAIRMYIALDQSPLHLNAFRVQQLYTTPKCLTHALTVHYLSAVVLGAGWVVGGLELLGAPGALAARVGGATGGVRGVASTAAAALLRSLSACAGSLARNLDLLAGDEEHARRAAAARRRPPDSFVGGLVTGITNFAINILGAVGGLAHHPLVGVAVGEPGGGAAALRRSLVGAVAKPLSATADLVAYAGHGLLKQTGWDPVPQPLASSAMMEKLEPGWQRDCVHWGFQLADRPVTGFNVLLDNVPVLLLITTKYIFATEKVTEKILDVFDMKSCTVGPFSDGRVILLTVKCKTQNATEKKLDSKEEFLHQMNEATMKRVARYTGAEEATVAAASEARVVTLVTSLAQAPALYAALLTYTHCSHDNFFSLY